MTRSLVAIVGRPNVGKSSLFNALAGRRISIISDESGTTRDRVTAPVEWAGGEFTLVDTGGVDFDTGNAFAAHIREQVDIAIELADVVVFLVDGMDGVTPADSDIAQILRRSKKPVVLAVNKLDNIKREEEIFDFYRLNLGEPVGISCTQKRGLGDLLDKICANFDKQPPYDDGARKKIAIVGKPNAGKSSIINRLVGEKRVMVSEISGTTRDRIDLPFNYMGREYILTDTAGVRRKRSVEVETVEFYSVLRALNAIRESDVCIIVLDATQGITEQDVRLAGYVHNECKPSVIVVNKWDIAGDGLESDRKTDKEELFKRWNARLSADLAFMPYFKAVFCSAVTGQRIGDIMRAVELVLKNAEKRITTGKLNQMFLDFAAVNPTLAKIKYATQASVCPPTFAVFVGKSKLLSPTYVRYLENSLRKEVDFTGTPIRIFIREKGEKE